MSLPIEVTLPTESTPIVQNSEVKEVDGTSYRVSWSVSKDIDMSLKKTPQLEKLETIVDDADPNVKFYVYRKTYTSLDKDGKPITRSNIIKRKYVKHESAISNRLSVTDAVIKEMQAEEHPKKSVWQLWQNDYLERMKSHPDIKPYSYAAFMKRWQSA